jgi:hypothetical protein
MGWYEQEPERLWGRVVAALVMGAVLLAWVGVARLVVWLWG